MLMIIAIPAGIAMALSGLVTHTVARSFDGEPPARWTARRHAREYASFAVLTLWVTALLMAGEAVLRVENGQETLRLLLLGAGIAALGALPALLAAGRGWAARRRV
jgi:hypothetical protein